MVLALPCRRYVYVGVDVDAACGGLDYFQVGKSNCFRRARFVSVGSGLLLLCLGDKLTMLDVVAEIEHSGV